MTRKITSFAAFLATAACQQPATTSAEKPRDNQIVVSDVPENSSTTTPIDQPPVAPRPPTSAAQAPTSASQPPAPHLDPDAKPIPDEKGPLGAARRLQEYCDAVATKRYRTAYSYWGGGGQASGMTFAQFRDSFGKYGAYDCHIGKPGETDGAAGSIYIEIPLQVTGVLSNGGGFRLVGPVTMKRVNDVDGATPAQLRWHIVNSGLKPRS